MKQSDHSEGCREFLALIEEHFRYLFGNYDFEIIDSRDVAMGEHCLVILQSRDCRFKFISDQGSVEISVGPLSTPISWEDNPDGRIAWFPIDGIPPIIQEQPSLAPEEQRKLGEAYFSMSTSELMRTLSATFKPLMGEIVTLFRDDVFRERQHEIERHFQI